MCELIGKGKLAIINEIAEEFTNGHHLEIGIKINIVQDSKYRAGQEVTILSLIAPLWPYLHICIGQNKDKNKSFK